MVEILLVDRKVSLCSRLPKEVVLPFLLLFSSLLPVSHLKFDHLSANMEYFPLIVKIMATLAIHLYRFSVYLVKLHCMKHP